MDKKTQKFIYKVIWTVFIMILAIVSVINREADFVSAVLGSAITIGVVNFFIGSDT